MPGLRSLSEYDFILLFNVSVAQLPIKIIIF